MSPDARPASGLLGSEGFCCDLVGWGAASVGSVGFGGELRGQGEGIDGAMLCGQGMWYTGFSGGGVPAGRRGFELDDGSGVYASVVGV